MPNTAPDRAAGQTGTGTNPAGRTAGMMSTRTKTAPNHILYCAGFRVPDVSGFRMKSFPTEGVYGRGLSRIRDLRTQAATDRYGDSVCNQPGTLKYMIASVSVFAGIGERRCRADSGGGAEVARTSVGLCRAFVVRPADFPPGLEPRP